MEFYEEKKARTHTYTRKKSEKNVPCERRFQVSGAGGCVGDTGFSSGSDFDEVDPDSQESSRMVVEGREAGEVYSLSCVAVVV